ncbi:hypothetical protein GQ53DRAFT_445803 [Thozetella sp. PMI_491]|nr:hypothetical protein GQ53DRAFT_445803 [Thozetella sp. PMI_491]
MSSALSLLSSSPPGSRLTHIRISSAPSLPYGTPPNAPDLLRGFTAHISMRGCNDPPSAAFSSEGSLAIRLKNKKSISRRLVSHLATPLFITIGPRHLHAIIESSDRQISLVSLPTIPLLHTLLPLHILYPATGPAIGRPRNIHSTPKPTTLRSCVETCSSQPQWSGLFPAAPAPTAARLLARRNASA